MGPITRRAKQNEICELGSLNMRLRLLQHFLHSRGTQVYTITNGIALHKFHIISIALFCLFCCLRACQIARVAFCGCIILNVAIYIFPPSARIHRRDFPEIAAHCNSRIARNNNNGRPSCAIHAVNWVVFWRRIFCGTLTRAILITFNLSLRNTHLYLLQLLQLLQR